jgi:AGCS family alanine or glycine:cation symporter
LIASGSFIHLNTIWILADIVNGLMAIPNLIGLLLLRHVVINETRAYFNQEAASPARAEHTTCSQVH